MANADRTYVDPSALRSLYLQDDMSRAFCAWRRRVGGSLLLTRHGYAELVNSMALAVFRGDAHRLTAEAALADLNLDIAEGRLNLADVLWRRTLDRAVVLSRLHTPDLGTRSLDVLHVAAALVLEMKTFVSFDVRQCKLAKVTGLRVLRP